MQQDLINVMQARIKNLEEQNTELKLEVKALKEAQHSDNTSYKSKTSATNTIGTNQNGKLYRIRS